MDWACASAHRFWRPTNEVSNILAAGPFGPREKCAHPLPAECQLVRSYAMTSNNDRFRALRATRQPQNPPRPIGSTVAEALGKLRDVKLAEADAIADIVSALSQPSPQWLSTRDLLTTLPFGRTKLDALSRDGEFTDGVHYVTKGGSRYWNSAAMSSWMATSDRPSLEPVALRSIDAPPPAVEPIGVKRRAA